MFCLFFLLAVHLIFFFFFLMIRRPPRSTLFPTRRSSDLNSLAARQVLPKGIDRTELNWTLFGFVDDDESMTRKRSEEHTSELQSRPHLVCRLLLEKKKKKNTQ